MMISYRQADLFDRINRINNIPLFFDRGRFVTSGSSGDKDYFYVCRNPETINADKSIPQIQASVLNNEIVALSYPNLDKHIKFLGYEISKEDHKSDPMVITVFVRGINK